MLFLFENILTHYIYSILYLDKTGAPRSQSGQILYYEQTRHADRHTIAPDLSSLTPMSNHTRTASGRTTTATPSPTSRATFTPMSNHTQNNTQCKHLPQHHHPAGLSHIPVKSGLTSSIPMDCRDRKSTRLNSSHS